MSLLADIAKELLGMFLTDARLSGAVLVLVLIVAVLAPGFGVPHMVAGAVLILGCLVILIEAAWREARRAGHR